MRTAELLREEAEVLDVVVDTALAGRDRIALEHLTALPPALARLIVRRLAEAATGGLCARAPARLDDILALGDDGALDVGDGARAVVSGGVLRFEATPPLVLRRAARARRSTEAGAARLGQFHRRDWSAPSPRRGARTTPTRGLRSRARSPPRRSVAARPVSAAGRPRL